MGVCHVCKGIFNGAAKTVSDPRWPGYDDMKHHHESNSSFLSSVDQGCPICRALRVPGQDLHSVVELDEDVFSKLEADHTVLTSTAILVQSQYPGFDVDTSIHFSLKAAGGDPGGTRRTEGSRRVAYLLSASSDSEALTSTDQEPSAARNTGDSGVLQLAKRWLEKCKTHSSCLDTRSTTWLPTRLLDIDVPEDAHSFRLIHTDALNSDKSHYFTLSHRWGDASFLQLLQSNERDLCKPYPIAALPKTFSDAILVCRHFRVRYLWIDSLCIMQDSASDWEKEARTMCKVYANGMCNIAATETGSAYEGLFRRRDRSLVERLHVDIVDGALPGVRAGTYNLTMSEHLGKRIHMAVLNTRGWVFQERMLSRRILHFLSDRIAWECDTTIFIEGIPNAVTPQITDWYNKGLANFRIGSAIGSEQEGLTTCRIDCRFCTAWFSLIRAYSVLEFAYPDDKPWALLGLAERIQEISEDEHMAGLWRRHLTSQLLWTEDSPKYHDTIPNPGWPGGCPKPRWHPRSRRKLPSFSPLATDGRVARILPPSSRVSFKILEISGLTTSDLTRLEGVTTQRGYLKIKGTLKATRLHPDEKYSVIDPSDLYPT